MQVHISEPLLAHACTLAKKFVSSLHKLTSMLVWLLGMGFNRHPASFLTLLLALMPSRYIRHDSQQSTLAHALCRNDVQRTRLDPQGKHRHRKARNSCACHAKRIVSDSLQIHHACQRFCNPHELLRLPRILQPVEIYPCACHATNHFEPPKTSRDRQFLTVLTSKSISRAGVVQILRSSTSKSAPNPRCFNDFDLQIALARRSGAIFAKLNFQKCSDAVSF